MNIDPLSNSSYVQQARINNRPKSQDDEAISADRDTDSLSTETSENVRSALASMPEVRPEVVERGRQLAADSDYPSQDIVNKIASLITPLSED
jgi:cytidylate kinase